MRQLISLSNCPNRQEHSPDNYDWLEPLLARRHLDGIEVDLRNIRELKKLPSPRISGAHLSLGASWFDFWRQDRQALLYQFGSEAGINARYGTLDRDEWLEGWRQKIDGARAAGARYLVLPVSEVKPWETYTWQFGTNDTDVAAAAVEVVNELIARMPADMTILFANKWWPGLRLLDKQIAARLIHGVKHPNIGFMLDTGHLMNTNQNLKTEVESVEYILAVLRKLGPYGRYIRGVHLNCSLSGEYVQRKQKQGDGGAGGKAELAAHLVHIDEHRPFRVPAVKRIIYAVRPELLVHHFRAELICDWERKIRRQQEALLSPAERRRQGVGICR